MLIPSHIFNTFQNGVIQRIFSSKSWKIIKPSVWYLANEWRIHPYFMTECTYQFEPLLDKITAACIMYQRVSNGWIIFNKLIKLCWVWDLSDWHIYSKINTTWSLIPIEDSSPSLVSTRFSIGGAFPSLYRVLWEMWLSRVYLAVIIGRSGEGSSLHVYEF